MAICQKSVAEEKVLEERLSTYLGPGQFVEERIWESSIKMAADEDP